jgi:tRNA-splicing ligase RtcB
VRAAKGVLGIIPGSMGAKSFIVRGLGNAESFDSCSHGAGRVMSRTAAKRWSAWPTTSPIPRASNAARMGVIDETPRAYKPIEAVMARRPIWSRSSTH